MTLPGSAPTATDVAINDEIEKLIQEKGLTAPRVTPADIESNIASERYFTAEHGVEGAVARGELWQIDRTLRTVESRLHLLTFCVLVLQNGFIVTGEAACASPENFNAETGRAAARKDAVSKIWPLMGYALCSKLAAVE